MATQLFTLAAGALDLGKIGKFTAAVVGAYIDSQLILALGGGNEEGPRTDEFRATSSKYGEAIPIIYGPRNRVRGNIIWTDGITETGTNHKYGGGIFGGSTRTREYTYSTSLAIAFAGREIVSLRRIWANNKVIYTNRADEGDQPTASFGSDQAARSIYLLYISTGSPITREAAEAIKESYEDTATPAEVITASGATTYVKSWIPDEFYDLLIAIHPDFAELAARLENGEQLGGSGITVNDMPTLDPSVPTVSIYPAWTYFWAYSNLRLYTNFFTLSDGFAIYNGSQSQLPDPTMESFLGAGNVPAYRGIAYVVIKTLQLTAEFGNRIPNFEFEVEADTSITIAEVLDSLSSKAGISNVSTIGLDTEVRGINVYKNSPLSSYLPSLEAAYRFRSVQQNGDIRFVPRPLGMAGSLIVEELGGHDHIEGKPDNGPIDYELVPLFETPSTVTITSFDINREYSTNSQVASREVRAGNNDYKLDIPYTLTADENREIAERVSKDLWARKWGVRFRTSDKHNQIQAGMTIGIEYNDEIRPVTVSKILRGRNGLLEVQGRYDDISTETVTVVAQEAASEAYEVVAGSSTFLWMIDGPLIATADDDGGIYFAVTGSNSSWTGATLSYLPSATSENWIDIGESNVAATVGYVSDPLASGQTVTWDRTNTLTVVLYSSENPVTSMTESEVLSGGNLAWVGGEIIQFVDATLVEGNTYTLSTLLRGRYGTEHAVGNHGEFEVFVLLDQASVGSISFDRADWDLTYFYRAAGPNEIVSGGDSLVIVNTGIRSKPLAPVHVQATRDASNNLTITWVRQARGTVLGFGSGPVPLNEEAEAYEVDITGPAGVLIRTITSTSETVTYSGTDQFNDGITPGDPVDVAIYQISSTKGRGYPARGTV